MFALISLDIIVLTDSTFSIESISLSITPCYANNCFYSFDNIFCAYKRLFSGINLSSWKFSSLFSELIERILLAGYNSKRWSNQPVYIFWEWFSKIETGISLALQKTRYIKVLEYIFIIEYAWWSIVAILYTYDFHDFFIIYLHCIGSLTLLQKVAFF